MLDTVIIIYWETNPMSILPPIFLHLSSFLLHYQLHHHHLRQELLLVCWLSHRASVHQIPAAQFTDCSLDGHIPHSVPSIVEKSVESVPSVVDQEALRHFLCRKSSWAVEAQVENFWPFAQCHRSLDHCTFFVRRRPDGKEVKLDKYFLR